MGTDRRLPRSAVPADGGFDMLQALHEAAADCLWEGCLDELTPGMRALTVLFAFCGDAENGGFAACMYNASGDWTGEAIAGARRVGADGHAELFERFAEVGLGGDLTLSGDARNARLEAMGDAEEQALERLDDELAELPPIDEPLERYVREHPEEFFVD